MHIQKLQTPAVLIDQQVVRNNIQLVQHIVDQQSIALRPHIKTHKSTEIFSWQAKAGAIGITASKFEEALPFIHEGCRSVLFAYPTVDQTKLDAFLEQISMDKDLEIILSVDSYVGLEVARKSANKYKKLLQILILINVGNDRCGLEPSDYTILNMAQKIGGYRNLHFKGLISHNGLTYSAKESKQVRKFNKSESKQLTKVKKKLLKKNIAVETISAGSTPGVLGQDESLSGITELRPGNYVFMDRTPLEMGLIHKDQIGLTVLSQIISENHSYYIIDAGKKVLSSDRRSSEDHFGWSFPIQHYAKKKWRLPIVKLSEEHGFIKKNKGITLEVGDKVRIIPNHSCVVANLTPSYCVVQKNQFISEILVDASRTSHGKNSEV